jgi:hypothetical protein
MNKVNDELREVNDELRKTIMQKRIYIAGKVTGLPRIDTVLKFEKAEKELSQLGYAVYNPVKYIPSDADRNSAMRIAFKLLVHADEIALLPDWKKSEGARWEYMIAVLLKMPVVLL